MNPTGTCALCQTQNVTMINSHIVSKWVYRRILAYDPGAASAPVGVDKGQARFSTQQATEHLLCRDCEDILSVRENYAAQVGLQPDGITFRAHAQAKVLEQIRGFAVADASALDTDMLTHFAVSVFWRADVAQIDPIVHLAGAREALRQYLLGGALPATVNVVLTLLRPPPNFPRIDRILIYPATSDDQQRHEFVASAMRFTMYTAAATPPPVEDFSLPRKKLVLISDGRALLNNVAEEVQTSTAYGKLATRK